MCRRAAVERPEEGKQRDAERRRGVRGGDKQSWVGRGGSGGGQRGRGRGEEGSGSDVRATINQVPD